MQLLDTIENTNCRPANSIKNGNNLKIINSKKMKKIIFTAIAIFGLATITMAQVPNYVPTNGLVGWWPFNGNANDESGIGNNGVVNGATLSLDRFNNSNSAYLFNGTTNYIEVAHSASQNFTGGQSVSFWIYRTGMIPAGGVQNHILSKGAQLWSGQNIWAGDANNYINYHYINGNYNTANNCGTAGNSFLSNNWLHYVVTNDLSNINVYLNGNLVQTCPILNPSTTLTGTAQGPMNFGKGRGHFAGEQGFQGRIDDIGIWDRALTAKEVTDLYNASSCSNDLVITPQNNTSQTGGSVSFTATTSDLNPNFVWQSDFGQGFQTLNNFGNYSGVNTNTLSINNLQLANHLQQFRAISTSGNCIDTSNVATITLTDTCINYITVTDTLIINTTLSLLSQPNNVNTIIVYPNPASTHITIDYGDYTLMNGYTLQIVNTLGQTMYTTPINQQSSYIDLTTWTGNGLYFVQIIDPQNNTIENRKIVIQ